MKAHLYLYSSGKLGLASVLIFQQEGHHRWQFAAFISLKGHHRWLRTLFCPLDGRWQGTLTPIAYWTTNSDSSVPCFIRWDSGLQYMLYLQYVQARQQA